MKRMLLLLVLFASPAYAVGTQGYVNVRDHGVIGDGIADDWAALQNVIDNVAQERGTIYFPAGDYRITSTLNCGTRSFNFKGDGRPMPYSIWTIPGNPPVILGGSFVRGNFAGPLLQSFYPAGMLSIQDMGFANRNTTAGAGLLLSGSNVALLRVSVYAWRAVEMAPSAFSVTLQQIVLRGPAGWPAGSRGLSIRGHALVHGADIVGFETGFRATGIGNDARSMRIERCKVAVELGVNPDGSTNPITGGSIESLSLEANDYGIVTRSATTISVRNVLIQGSVNAPSGQSKAGLVVHHSQWTAYEQVIASGSYTEGAIRVMPSQPTTVPVRFQLCKANNTLPGGVQWDTRPPDAMLVLEQCS
jgi:hypothetical protein